MADDRSLQLMKQARESTENHATEAKTERRKSAMASTLDGALAKVQAQAQTLARRERSEQGRRLAAEQYRRQVAEQAWNKIEQQAQGWVAGRMRKKVYLC